MQKIKWFSGKVFGAALAVGALFLSVGAAEIGYAEAVQRVEKWIPQQFTTPRARKLQEAKLDKILNSSQSEAAQLAELRRTFPAAFENGADATNAPSTQNIARMAWEEQKRFGVQFSQDWKTRI